MPKKRTHEVLQAPQRETHEQVTERMVRNPLSWPHLMLPLKKRGQTGRSDTAVLAASLIPPHTYVLYKGANIWHLDPKIEGVAITADAVLAEGWLVD